MGYRRTLLQTSFFRFLSAEPSDRSIRGDDSVARDERSERVIRESGAHCTYTQRANASQHTDTRRVGRVGWEVEDKPERGEPSPRVSQIALYVVTFPTGICRIKS